MGFGNLLKYTEYTTLLEHSVAIVAFQKEHVFKIAAELTCGHELLYGGHEIC